MLPQKNSDKTVNKPQFPAYLPASSARRLPPPTEENVKFRVCLGRSMHKSSGTQSTAGVETQPLTAKQLLAELAHSPGQLLWIGPPCRHALIVHTYQSPGTRTVPLAQPTETAEQTRLARPAAFTPTIPLADAGWHAIVVSGIWCGLNPLAIWDQLATALQAGGLVVLICQEATASRMPRWQDYLIEIGHRCGFESLTLNSDGVHEGTAQESETIHVLRKLHTQPRWELRHARPSNSQAIAALFSEVFGHRISQALWEWKYGDDRGHAVIAVRNGAVVAHYGGIYRDILLTGQPDWAFQICDVMVHPKERGVMTRQGPFLLTAAIGAEIFGPLGFGFPNARAMAVAEKMGLYAPVGRLATVTWVAGEPGVRWKTALRLLDQSHPADAAVVNGVWSAMAGDLAGAVVGVRDWRYLVHRYLNHPENCYEVIAVMSRWTRRWLGIMVLRKLETSVELLDVIAPLTAIPALVDQARRLAALWGKPSVYCWITVNYVHRFLVHGGVQSDPDVTIPTSVWTQDERAHLFKDKWWLMSGDTDFR